MNEQKTVDLRTCKPGDKLRLRNGDTAVYAGLNDSGVFRHNVECGTAMRTNLDCGGWFQCNGTDAFDVVEIVGQPAAQPAQPTAKTCAEMIDEARAKMRADIEAAQEAFTNATGLGTSVKVSFSIIDMEAAQ